VFVRELLKLGPYGKKYISGRFLVEDTLGLFRSTTTPKEEQSSKDLVLITDKLVYG